MFGTEFVFFMGVWKPESSPSRLTGLELPGMDDLASFFLGRLAFISYI
jgi:hypothetical protein